MNRLRAHLLGRFDLVCNERPLHLSQPRLQSLLAYLLLRHPTAQPRQHLAYLLWGEVGEQQARTNLRNLLFQLRQAWPTVDQFLQIDRQELGWQPGVELVVDVAQFEAALQEKTLAAWQQARAFYTGPLLPTLFDEWVLGERDRLQAHFLTALDKLAVRYTELGNHGEALLYTEELVRHDPLREESYRQLMRLYAALADRARLEQSYRRCVETLQRELGVAPDPNTTDLYQTLLRSTVEQATPISPAQVTALPMSEGVPRIGTAQLYNFPAQSPLLIARPQTIAHITTQLLDPTCRLLTLLGPGGMGKTSLAIATAHAVADRPPFVDGLYFVDLSLVAAPNQMLSAVVRALNLALHDQETPYQQLLHHLQPRRALLVLDNYEHLLPNLELVAALLQQAPNVKLLVTSREALNLRAEKRFPVPGLSHPGQSDADPGATVLGASASASYEAVDLFLRIATHLQPEFVLTQQARREIERICQLVDGSPLALEMAAGWLRLFDCHEICTHLEESLDFLVAQSHDVITRQQSMRTVIEQSWQLLTTAEQQILAQMAVFIGAFTPEMAMAITGARVVDLSVLLDKTFLLRRGGRLRLHQLLHQFAGEKLRQIATPAAVPLVWERHARAYLGRLTAHERELFGARPMVAIRQLELDLDNISAAWRWASVAGNSTLLAASLSGLMRLLTLRHLLNEADDLLTIAMQHIRTALVEPDGMQGSDPARAETTLYAQLLLYQAETRYGLEDTESAIALADEVIQRASRNNDLATLAHAHLLLGRLYCTQLQFALADTHLAQALTFSQRVGEQTRLHGLIYAELGKLHRGRSNYAVALTYQHQAHALLRSLGDRTGEAEALYDIALIHWDAWQLQQAQRFVEQALALLQQVENLPAVAECQFLIGALYVRREQYAAAQQTLEQVLAIAERSGLKGVLAETEQMLSEVYLKQGQPVLARQALQRAIVLYPTAGHAERVFECLFILADIDGMAGDFQSACDHLLQALHGFKELNYTRGIIHTSGKLGYVYRSLGDYRQAQQYLDATIADCQTHNEQSYLPFCFVERARVAQAQNDLASARRDATAALAVLARLGQVENAIAGSAMQQQAQEILAHL